MKEHIRAEKLAAKEKDQTGSLTDKLMAKLLEGHDFEVPKRLVGYEVGQLIEEMETRLQNQGMSLEAAGLNRDKLTEEYQGIAEKRVRGDFILKKIAEQEGIKVTDEDVAEGFQRIAERYEMPLEEVKKFFTKRDDLMPYMNELLNEKILKFLGDQATIKTVAAEEAAGEKV